MPPLSGTGTQLFATTKVRKLGFHDGDNSEAKMLYGLKQNHEAKLTASLISRRKTIFPFQIPSASRFAEKKTEYRYSCEL